jgi:ankyrin repeat protein
MTSVLVSVSSKGDLIMLQRVLDGEFETITEEDLCEALLRASCHGYLDCVSKLLERGADPDCEDLDGDTPLMLASSNDHLGVAKLLIKSGCDVDVRSDRNRTALHMAVWNQRRRIVQLLLDARCDVNVRDRYGDTALMLCARRGYADIMKILLSAGCDANKASYEKETALHYAARHGHTECLRLLLPHCTAAGTLDAPTVWGLTPLMVAAAGGSAECALELLSAGASVTSLDLSRKSVLHHAVRHDMFPLAEWSLELGADPDGVDSDGQTPVFEAVVACRPRMVQLLIGFGCRVRDVIGRATLGGEYRWSSPLEVAINMGQLMIARLLYVAGCEFRSFVLPVTKATLSGPAADTAIVDWVDRKCREPRPLQDLARIVIRESLGARVVHKLNTLHLPSTLTAYLALNDDAEFDD